MIHYRFNLVLDPDQSICMYPKNIYIFFYENGKAKISQYCGFTLFDSWYSNHEDALNTLEWWTSANNYELNTFTEFESSESLAR